MIVSPAAAGMSWVAYAQLGRAVPTTPWELITNASGVTKLVLAVLVLLSVVSWAIMLAKWAEFRRVEAARRPFIRQFEHVTRVEDARALVHVAEPSPFTRVLERAVEFAGSPVLAGGAIDTATLTGSQVEALRLVLDSETTRERDQLGRFIPSLATIGSVSPLIGLLGTVLGVIDAFVGIATRGSGNLGAVAPGVAEALVATAAALTVAIPAVFGYNIFAGRLNRIDGELDAFGTEMIAMMVREGHI
jgi:biopolymer transport protein TolQ